MNDEEHVDSLELTDSVQLPTDQRSMLLEREIAKYMHRGFRVMYRTALVARLVKPKESDRRMLFPSPEEEVTLKVDPVGRVSRG